MSNRLFVIGPYTFTEHPRTNLDFVVHVNLVDEHLATLDACYPIDTDRVHVRKDAATWAALQMTEHLERAIKIMATGSLNV